jgi:hypothetical protein
MTCWDQDGAPTIAHLGILEWEADRAEIHQPDVEWLSAFTLAWKGTVG